jgi:hypothetical protein
MICYLCNKKFQKKGESFYHQFCDHCIEDFIEEEEKKEAALKKAQEIAQKENDLKKLKQLLNSF